MNASARPSHHGRRPVSARPRLLLVLLAASLPTAWLSACASAPPAVAEDRPGPQRDARATAPGRHCPPPMVFDRPADRPRFVRIENPGTRTLDVWLDRCFHHTRLAAVQPGKYQQVELPDRLVDYPEGLVFHVYDTDAATRLGTFVVPAGSGIVTLELDSAGAVRPSPLARYALPDARVVEGPVLDERRGFVSVWAEQGGGVLSWTCGEGGEPGLSTSLLGRVSAEGVDVRFRIGEGAWRDAGSWAVQGAVGAAAVAPAEEARSLTRHALHLGGATAGAPAPIATPEAAGGGGEVERGATLLDLVFHTGAGARQTHRFDTRGVGEALRRLGCWADAVPAPAAPAAATGGVAALD